MLSDKEWAEQWPLADTPCERCGQYHRRIPSGVIGPRIIEQGVESLAQEIDRRAMAAMDAAVRPRR